MKMRSAPEQTNIPGVEELPKGFRIEAGPAAERFAEWVRQAARKLDIQLAERNGCIVFSDAELGLRVLNLAARLSGAPSQ